MNFLVAFSSESLLHLIDLALHNLDATASQATTMRHPTPNGRSQAKANTNGAPTPSGSGEKSDDVCRGQEGCQAKQDCRPDTGKAKGGRVSSSSSTGTQKCNEVVIGQKDRQDGEEGEHSSPSPAATSES
ncbi:MAG: hypothetical protein Q9208_006127 [Pyrenodesmia sp. 3 TL-2023]